MSHPFDFAFIEQVWSGVMKTFVISDEENEIQIKIVYSKFKYGWP